MTEGSPAATGSSLTDSVPDKVVLVGDVGVGKTSIFLRFKTGEFQETTPSHNPRDGEYQKEWPVAGSSVSVSCSETHTTVCNRPCVTYVAYARCCSAVKMMKFNNSVVPH